MSRRTDNEKFQRRMKAREQDKARQVNDDLRRLLADPAGRRVAWWLLDELTGLFGPTFTGNSQTFHLEGRRSVGIDFMQRIQAVDPDAYVQMMREQMDELKEQKVHQKAAEAAREDEYHD